MCRLPAWPVWVGLTILARLGQAAVTQPVAFTYTNNIQTGLISTFPTGTYTATDGTQFSIPSAAGNCGPSANQPCNFFDNGTGQFTAGNHLTINVSLPDATDVYTLINGYFRAIDTGTVGTVEFLGTGGTSITFNLIGGNDLRDFYNSGQYVNTLTNTVPGVNAVNTFECNDPSTCLGAGATGNVATGHQGNYVVDEQHFSLGSTFAGQTLTQIIITSTTSNVQVIVLGVTATYTPSAPVPMTPVAILLLTMALAGIGFYLLRRALARV